MNLVCLDSLFIRSHNFCAFVAPLYAKLTCIKFLKFEILFCEFDELPNNNIFYFFLDNICDRKQALLNIYKYKFLF